jgi:hypothetical protein
LQNCGALISREFVSATIFRQTSSARTLEGGENMKLAATQAAMPVVSIRKSS